MFNLSMFNLSFFNLSMFNLPNAPLRFSPPNFLRSRDSAHSGYDQVDSYDFAVDAEICLPMRREELVHPHILHDEAKRSKSRAICSFMLLVSFFFMVIWYTMSINSKDCETIDISSVIVPGFVIQAFKFKVPTLEIWIGITAALFGLLVSSAYAFFIATKLIVTKKKAQIYAVIHNASAFFIQQNAAALPPIVILFIITGCSVNWRTAASFAIGALACIVSSRIGLTITSKANFGVSSAAHTSLGGAISVAGRCGAVICLSSLSLAIAGISVAYLMSSDIRALLGFSTGAAIIALYMRVSGGLYTRAKRSSAALLVGRKRRRFLRNSTVVKDYIGSGAGDISGIGPDLLDTFASSVIVTALLGSCLPFFYQDKFAMCVFNHLRIDQECGPFGYPKVLSYAVNVCKNENLYLSYPSLTTWASNTAFVAVPFILGAVGVLTSIVCTSYVRIGTKWSSRRGNVENILYNLRKNMWIGCILLTISFAVVFFGLFGPYSHFQKSVGFSSADNLKRVELNGSAQQCVTLAETGEDRNNSFHLVRGVSRMGKYSPLTAAGGNLFAANQTAWRLFGCSIIGIAVGAVVAGLSSFYFTSLAKGPTIRLAQAARFSATAALMTGFRNGLMGSVVQAGMILAAVVSGYSLYGAYGIGITTIAYVSSSGIISTGSVLGSIADSANEIGRTLPLSLVALSNSELVDLVGSSMTASGIEYSNGAAALTGITVLMGVIQQSGMIPSPRDLVGSIEGVPHRVIESRQVWATMDMSYVILGASLPFVATGFLLLAVERAAQVMRTGEARQNRGRQYMLFQTVLLECSSAMIVILMAPLVVGFLFGQKALVGMLASVIATGYLVGSCISIATNSWKSGEKLIGCGRFGQEHSRGSAWHENCDVVNEMGSSLRDLVSPSLRMITKATGSISLLAVTAMHIDGRDRWIGEVLIAVCAIEVGLLTWWRVKAKRNGLTEVQEEEGKGKQIGFVISPFVVEDMESQGRCERGVSPESSDGMSDRSETEEETRREYMWNGTCQLEEICME